MASGIMCQFLVLLTKAGLGLIQGLYAGNEKYDSLDKIDVQKISFYGKTITDREGRLISGYKIW